MKEKSVLFRPNEMRSPSCPVPMPVKSLARAMRPLKWKMFDSSTPGPGIWL